MANSLSPPSFEEDQRCRQKITEQEFRAGLSDDDLVRCIDMMAYGEGGWVRNVSDYQAELTRRETERQNRRLEMLTWVIAALTVVLIALEVLPRILGVDH